MDSLLQKKMQHLATQGKQDWQQCTDLVPDLPRKSNKAMSSVDEVNKKSVATKSHLGRETKWVMATLDKFGQEIYATLQALHNSYDVLGIHATSIEEFQ